MMSRKVSLRVLRQKIKTFTHKYKNIRPSSRALKNDIVRRSLDSLHDNFAIVLVGKTNDNMAIICKRFCMQVLMKELGIDNKSNTKSTLKYLPNTNKEVLISSHSNFILINFQRKAMKKINVHHHYTRFLN